MTQKIPLGSGEALFLSPSASPCEVCTWPTEGLALRLVETMRARHGKGGLNACAPCVHRARAAATLGVITQALRTRRFRFNRETELQAGIAAVLTEAGLPVEREKTLGGAGRIDLFVSGVGIEVKVAGAVDAVRRQLERYAASADVFALVLVTSRWQGSGVPDMLSGKPVRVHVIARGFGG